MYIIFCLLSEDLGYHDDGEEFVGAVDELKAGNDGGVRLGFVLFFDFLICLYLFIMRSYSVEKEEEMRTENKKHKKSSLTRDDLSSTQKNSMFSFVKPGLSNTQGPLSSVSAGNSSHDKHPIISIY
jgi:hypothetical protein